MRATVAAALTRWRVALTAGLVLGTVFGLIEGFSIFSLAFARDLGIERGAASGMYAIYLLASTLSAPMAGRLVDRLGPRRIVLGTFPVFAFGVFLCSTANQLWQLYVIYVGIIATSTTLLIISCQVIVNNHYSRDRGTALGVAYACVGAGNFVLFNLLGRVVENEGWRAAYVVAAVVAGFSALIFLFLSRSLPPTAVPESTAEAGNSHELWTAAPSVGSPFRMPSLWFLCLAAFAASVLDFVIFQHTVPFLVTSGYTESSASFMLGLASLGYVAGQLGAGVLSDRRGREQIGTAAAAIFVVGIFGLWALPAPWLVAVVSGVLGLSVGAVIGCRSAALGDLFAGRSLGSVSGTVQVASALGAAFGTWIGGLGFDITGSYTVTFAAVWVCAGIWTAALWLAAPRRMRRDLPSNVSRP